MDSFRVAWEDCLYAPSDVRHANSSIAPALSLTSLGRLTNIIGLRLLGDMLLANGQARSSLK